MGPEGGRSGARWQAVLPGVATLRGYDRSWLRGDLLAGVTVTAYLVPQVMAYAGVAGLPAVTGLWAATGALLVYAVLGTSRQLSVGPESTTALMTASAVGAVALGDPARYAALAAVLAGIVGVICVLAWVARLGFLADLLSRPVLVGYLAGVAALMAVSQLGKVTRLPVKGDNPVAQVAFVVRHAGEAHLPTVLLAAGVLVLLFVAGWRWPKAPYPLLAVLASVVVAAALGLEGRGVRLVGDVPRALPALSLPDVTVDDVVRLVPGALGVAIVAFSDNVLTGRAFADRASHRIDNNQELLALGGANLVAGAAQGFPVSSSGSRTAIGDAVGSRTQAHSLVAVATIVLAVAFLSPVLAAFPQPALGALVVYAAVRLVDVTGFRRAAAFRRSELVLAVGTTVGVLAIGVLQGVLVAVTLSLLDLLRRVTRPHDAVLGYVPGVAGMHDVDDYATARPVPGLVVYRYDSPLFFANADDFSARALEAVEAAPTPARWLLLNAEANVTVDLTAVDALEQLRAEAARRGLVFAMARVKQELRDDLARAGFLQRVGEDRVFMTLPTAVQAYVRWCVETTGAPPEGIPAEGFPPVGPTVSGPTVSGPPVDGTTQAQ